MKNEDISRLQTMEFWPHLNKQEQDFMLKNTFEVEYEPGWQLHDGTRQCLGLILLKSGVLRVYILSEEGREVTLFRLMPSEVCILSASCMLEHFTFDIFIDAEESCKALLMPTAAFSKLSGGNLHVENFANKTVANRLQEAMFTLKHILFSRFDQRLASFLQDETRRSGSDTVRMTHEQIARNTGSAREVVSRMLKYFENEGIVSLSRGGVRIVNKKKLQELV